jgi:hypothetical protein
MKRTQPNFVIRGSLTQRTSNSTNRLLQSTGLSDFHKQVIENRQEKTIQNTHFQDFVSKKAMVSIESRIFELQDKSIAIVEALELQTEKEKFLDQEIAALSKEINELRKSTATERTARSTQLNTAATFFKASAGSTMSGGLASVELASQKQKLALVLNEIKAKNLHKRDQINDLR